MKRETCNMLLKAGHVYKFIKRYKVKYGYCAEDTDSLVDNTKNWNVVFLSYPFLQTHMYPNADIVFKSGNNAFNLSEFIIIRDLGEDKLAKSLAELKKVVNAVDSGELDKNKYFNWDYVVNSKSEGYTFRLLNISAMGILIYGEDFLGHGVIKKLNEYLADMAHNSGLEAKRTK